MKKRLLLIAGVLVATILIVFLVREIRLSHYPYTAEPSPTWEPYVRSLDAQRQRFAVQAADGVQIEAELFIPNGGSEAKATMVWTSGCSDGAYHNYSFSLIETYVLDIFLSRDIAVLLTNRRGVGQS